MTRRVGRYKKNFRRASRDLNIDKDKFLSITKDMSERRCPTGMSMQYYHGVWMCRPTDIQRWKYPECFKDGQWICAESVDDGSNGSGVRFAAPQGRWDGSRDGCTGNVVNGSIVWSEECYGGTSKPSTPKPNPGNCPSTHTFNGVWCVPKGQGGMESSPSVSISASKTKSVKRRGGRRRRRRG